VSSCHLAFSSAPPVERGIVELSRHNSLAVLEAI
jgi:hypothetical protein